MCTLIIITFPGKFGIKENAKDPVQFRTAKNVGLIAGGTGEKTNSFLLCT